MKKTTVLPPEAKKRSSAVGSAPANPNAAWKSNALPLPRVTSTSSTVKSPSVQRPSLSRLPVSTTSTATSKATTSAPKKTIAASNATPPTQKSLLSPQNSSHVTQTRNVTDSAPPSLSVTNIAAATFDPFAHLQLGKRVVVTVNKLPHIAVVRYMGSIQDMEGPWCGVELKEPRGKNAGDVKGQFYFTCEPNCGLFLRPANVVPDLTEHPSTPTLENNSRRTSRDASPATKLNSLASDPDEHSQAGHRTPVDNSSGGEESESQDQNSTQLEFSSTDTESDEGRHMHGSLTQKMGREDRPSTPPTSHPASTSLPANTSTSHTASDPLTALVVPLQNSAENEEVENGSTLFQPTLSLATSCSTLTPEAIFSAPKSFNEDEDGIATKLSLQRHGGSETKGCSTKDSGINITAIDGGRRGSEVDGGLKYVVVRPRRPSENGPAPGRTPKRGRSPSSLHDQTAFDLINTSIDPFTHLESTADDNEQSNSPAPASGIASNLSATTTTTGSAATFAPLTSDILTSVGVLSSGTSTAALWEQQYLELERKYKLECTRSETLVKKAANAELLLREAKTEAKTEDKIEAELPRFGKESSISSSTKGSGRHSRVASTGSTSGLAGDNCFSISDVNIPVEVVWERCEVLEAENAALRAQLAASSPATSTKQTDVLAVFTGSNSNSDTSSDQIVADRAVAALKQQNRRVQELEACLSLSRQEVNQLHDSLRRTEALLEESKELCNKLTSEGFQAYKRDLERAGNDLTVAVQQVNDAATAREVGLKQALCESERAKTKEEEKRAFAESQLIELQLRLSAFELKMKGKDPQILEGTVARLRSELDDLKEQLEAALVDKALFEEKCADVSEKQEDLEYRVEELKLEVEVAKERELDLKDSIINSLPKSEREGAMLVDQNVQLTVALAKLRCLLFDERRDASAQLREAVENGSGLREARARLDELNRHLTAKQDEIAELKASLDDAFDSEQMVARLTDVNLELSSRAQSQQVAISAMQEESELQAEIARAHAAFEEDLLQELTQRDRCLDRLSRQWAVERCQVDSLTLTLTQFRRLVRQLQDERETLVQKHHSLQSSANSPAHLSLRLSDAQRRLVKQQQLTRHALSLHCASVLREAELKTTLAFTQAYLPPELKQDTRGLQLLQHAQKVSHMSELLLELLPGAVNNGGELERHHFAHATAVLSALTTFPCRKSSASSSTITSTSTSIGKSAQNYYYYYQSSGNSSMSSSSNDPALQAWGGSLCAWLRAYTTCSLTNINSTSDESGGSEELSALFDKSNITTGGEAQRWVFVCALMVCLCAIGKASDLLARQLQSPATSREAFQLACVHAAELQAIEESLTRLVDAMHGGHLAPDLQFLEGLLTAGNAFAHFVAEHFFPSSPSDISRSIVSGIAPTTNFSLPEDNGKDIKQGLNTKILQAGNGQGNSNDNGMAGLSSALKWLPGDGLGSKYSLAVSSRALEEIDSIFSEVVITRGCFRGLQAKIHLGHALLDRGLAKVQTSLVGILQRVGAAYASKEIETHTQLCEILRELERRLGVLGDAQLLLELRCAELVAVSLSADPMLLVWAPSWFPASISNKPNFSGSEAASSHTDQSSNPQGVEKIPEKKPNVYVATADEAVRKASAHADRCAQALSRELRSIHREVERVLTGFGALATHLDAWSDEHAPTATLAGSVGGSTTPDVLVAREGDGGFILPWLEVLVDCFPPGQSPLKSSSAASLPLANDPNQLLEWLEVVQAGLGGLPALVAAHEAAQQALRVVEHEAWRVLCEQRSVAKQVRAELAAAGVLDDELSPDPVLDDDSGLSLSTNQVNSTFAEVRSSTRSWACGEVSVYMRHANETSRRVGEAVTLGPQLETATQMIHSLQLNLFEHTQRAQKDKAHIDSLQVRMESRQRELNAAKEKQAKASKEAADTLARETQIHKTLQTATAKLSKYRLLVQDSKKKALGLGTVNVPLDAANRGSVSERTARSLLSPRKLVVANGGFGGGEIAISATNLPNGGGEDGDPASPTFFASSAFSASAAEERDLSRAGGRSVSQITASPANSYPSERKGENEILGSAKVSGTSSKSSNVGTLETILASAQVFRRVVRKQAFGTLGSLGLPMFRPLQGVASTAVTATSFPFATFSTFAWRVRFPPLQFPSLKPTVHQNCDLVPTAITTTNTPTATTVQPLLLSPPGTASSSLSIGSKSTSSSSLDWDLAGGASAGITTSSTNAWTEVKRSENLFPTSGRWADKLDSKESGSSPLGSPVIQAPDDLQDNSPLALSQLQASPVLIDISCPFPQTPQQNVHADHSTPLRLRNALVSLEARVRKTADAATLNSSAINPVTSSAICSRSSSTSLQQESVGPVARLSIPRRFVGASTSTPLGDGDSHCNLQHRVVMGRRELNALVAMLQS